MPWVVASARCAVPKASFGTLQASAAYQGLVAAQSNFDKLLQRVNEEIGKGIEAGSQSRIILS